MFYLSFYVIQFAYSLKQKSIFYISNITLHGLDLFIYIIYIINIHIIYIYGLYIYIYIWVIYITYIYIYTGCWPTQCNLAPSHTAAVLVWPHSQQIPSRPRCPPWRWSTETSPRMGKMWKTFKHTQQQREGNQKNPPCMISLDVLQGIFSWNIGFIRWYPPWMYPTGCWKRAWNIGNIGFIWDDNSANVLKKQGVLNRQFLLALKLMVWTHF